MNHLPCKGYKQWALWKASNISDFAERLKNTTVEELLVKKVVYQEKRYSSFSNINKLDRARKQFAESINIGEYSVVKWKIGRPSLTEEMADNNCQS